MKAQIDTVPFALVLTLTINGRIAQAAIGLPVSWFEWVLPSWLERTVQDL